MLKYVDRTMAVILGLGAAIGHTYGSLVSYSDQPKTLLWSLSASVFGALLGVLQFLRSLRPEDRTLARILIVPTLCWAALSVEFGILIGNPLDPRVLLFVVVCLGLTFFGLQTARGRGLAGQIQ
jgi:uncharacterized membrane protein YfcA